MKYLEAMQVSAEVVGRCPSAEDGCFATDPFAYGIFINGSNIEPIYDIELQRVGATAIRAARAGVPLMNAAFNVPTLETTSVSILTRNETPIADVNIVDGPEIAVIDLAIHRDSISNMAYRIAQCAYVCAQREEGSCPIFVTFKEEE